MNFKITMMRNVQWGNSIARASFDLQTPEGIVIKDCLLKEGQFGWFISAPSKKLNEPYTDKDGNERSYLDVVWIPKELRDSLNALACETYDPHGNYTQFARTTTPKTAPVQMAGTASTTAEHQAPVFDESDIPT